MCGPGDGIDEGRAVGQRRGLRLCPSKDRTSDSAQLKLTFQISDNAPYNQAVDLDLIGKTLVLYDGVCGLCNGFVQLLLRYDQQDRFRYAALQSEFAAGILRRHGLNPAELSSVVLVTDVGLPHEMAHTRSDGVLAAARGLGGIWKLGLAAKVLPGAVRNWIYDLVARNRYRWFGRYETCPIPSVEQRVKFVDHTIEKT